jgi:hypothetical protein
LEISQIIQKPTKIEIVQEGAERFLLKERQRRADANREASAEAATLAT